MEASSLSVFIVLPSTVLMLHPLREEKELSSFPPAIMTSLERHALWYNSDLNKMVAATYSLIGFNFHFQNMHPI